MTEKPRIAIAAKVSDSSLISSLPRLLNQKVPGYNFEIMSATDLAAITKSTELYGIILVGDLVDGLTLDMRVLIQHITRLRHPNVVVFMDRVDIMDGEEDLMNLTELEIKQEFEVPDYFVPTFARGSIDGAITGNENDLETIETVLTIIKVP